MSVSLLLEYLVADEMNYALRSLRFVPSVGGRYGRRGSGLHSEEGRNFCRLLTLLSAFDFTTRMLNACVFCRKRNLICSNLINTTNN